MNTDLSVAHIDPPSSWPAIGLRELWDYRELLYFLTWRDIKVRYKQTVLGAAWAVIQPLFMMLVFSLFFGRLAGVPSDGIPYPVFTFCGLLPWQLFAHSLTQASNSLVGSQNLITKVYFPRLVVPISAVLGGVVDFAVAFILLLGMLLYYGKKHDKRATELLTKYLEIGKEKAHVDNAKTVLVVLKRRASQPAKPPAK